MLEAKSVLGAADVFTANSRLTSQTLFIPSALARCKFREASGKAT